MHLNTQHLNTLPQNTQVQNTQPLKILRMPALEAKLSISRSTIYDWLNPKSPRYDPTFPRPHRLGRQSVGWLESEIDNWILEGNAVNA